jgi:hypothetical protein
MKSAGPSGPLDHTPLSPDITKYFKDIEKLRYYEYCADTFGRDNICNILNSR